VSLQDKAGLADERVDFLKAFSAGKAKSDPVASLARNDNKPSHASTSKQPSKRKRTDSETESEDGGDESEDAEALVRKKVKAKHPAPAKKPPPKVAAPTKPAGVEKPVAKRKTGPQPPGRKLRTPFSGKGHTLDAPAPTKAPGRAASKSSTPKVSSSKKQDSQGTPLGGGDLGSFVIGRSKAGSSKNPIEL
jgi:hypothetical protein